MADPVLTLALAFVGAVVPAFLFRFDGRWWPLVGLSGMAGWGTTLLGLAWGWGPLASLFAGACVVAVWGEFVSWLLKAPAPAVLIGGIFPLVPGLTAFQALDAVLRRQPEAGQRGTEALGAALAVALGVLAVSGVTRIFEKKFRKPVGKKET